MSNTAENIMSLEKKVAAGDASAMNSLGCAYHQGNGVPKNYAKAYELFYEASKLNDTYATSNVALMYQYGQYVQRDILKAFWWYVKAVNQGSGTAACTLGEIFLEGEGGFPKNEHLAFFWFKRGLEMGDRGAEHQLSRCYEKGIGCIQNLEKAMQYCGLTLEDIKRVAKFYIENGYFYLNKWMYTSPLIKKNPFRIIGIYTNSSVRELTLSLSKINAYLKVGKSIRTATDELLRSLCPGLKEDEYKLISELTKEELDKIDISSLINLKKSCDKESQNTIYTQYRLSLLTPKRDDKIISEAKSLLSDKISKIKYSFFWFICASKEDERLFELIKSGKKDEAIKLWKKRKDFSALINLAVTDFLNESQFTTTFLENITKVIYSENLRQEFLEAVCGEKQAFSKSDLMRILIDALIHEMPEEDWTANFRMNFIEDDDYLYIAEFYAKKEIAIIDSLITTIDKHCPDLALTYDIIFHYILSVYPHLHKVKELLGNSDYRYEQISDKIADSVLSLSQRYFKESSSLVYEVTEQCVSFTEWALDTARGLSKIDALTQSLKEFKEIQDNLPSNKVFELIRDLGKKVKLWSSKEETVENALRMVEECAPLLVILKDELGKQDKNYLQCSTEVAECALNIAIGHFNQQRQAFEELEERCKKMLPTTNPTLANSHVMTFPDVRNALEALRKMLSNCCQLFANLDLFDVSNDWEARYTRNKTAIIKDAEEVAVNTNCKPTIDMRSEQEIFSDARTLVQLQAYLRRYGQTKAKFFTQACEKIKSLEKEDDDFWINVLRSHNYSSYLTKYPDGRHLKEAKEIIGKIQTEERAKRKAEDERYWELSKQHKVYKAYLAKYPNGLHASEAKTLLRQGNSFLEVIKRPIAITILVAAVITFLCLIFLSPIIWKM